MQKKSFMAFVMEIDLCWNFKRLNGPFQNPPTHKKNQKLSNIDRKIIQSISRNSCQIKIDWKLSTTI